MHSSLDVFLAFSIIGAIESVWVMAMMSHHQSQEPPVIRQLRRIALAICALSLLWGARFALELDWEPWRPWLFAVGAIDAYLGLTILAVYARRFRAGEAAGAVISPRVGAGVPRRG